MAVLIAGSSKATPHKAIAYILDPGKMETWCSRNLDSGIEADSKALAQQMMDTHHLYHKGYSVDERKYYHYKLSFHPDDRAENGGNLTSETALEIGKKVAMKLWPGNETVCAVHGDSNARHLHFVVNSVSILDGKKLDVRNSEWRMMKDYCQELCAEYGLKEMDWRQATIEKRERDRDSEDPVKETYAERGLRNRGEYCWKDELRGRIDFALKECKSMDEFKSMLKSLGVELPRCSDTTISYQMGVHKACRGDTLGGDYTIAAVKDALAHSAKIGKPEDRAKEQKGVLDNRINAAEQSVDVNRVITKEEYDRILQLGRLAGMKRTEIDALCDLAPIASWDEKQAVWRLYKQERDVLWEEWRRKEQDLRWEIDQAYWRKQAIRESQWMMTKDIRQRTLLGLIIILICVTIDKKVSEKIDRDIEKLKMQQAAIRREAAVLRSNSQHAVEILRQKGLTKGEYMDAVFALQNEASAQWRAYETTQLYRNAWPKQYPKRYPMTREDIEKDYKLKLQVQRMLQERELEKRYWEDLEKRAKEALEKRRKAEQAKNERDMGRR